MYLRNSYTMIPVVHKYKQNLPKLSSKNQHAELKIYILAIEIK